MNHNKYHIIAYHGWGFDQSIWKPMQSELPDHARLDLADRGYFSDPVDPEWEEKSDSETENLLMVHSYGLHWCRDKIIANTDHLVILGGYLNFHPSDKKEYQRSKIVLREMLAQFVDSPEIVLEKFYEKVFYPVKPQMKVTDRLNHDRLLADLSDLDRDNRNNARIFDVNTITIIHGAEDQIVSNKLAREMYTKLRLRSRYFEIKEGGHALPFTHSSKIFEILNSLLQFQG